MLYAETIPGGVEEPVQRQTGVALDPAIAGPPLRLPLCSKELLRRRCRGENEAKVEGKAE